MRTLTSIWKYRRAKVLYKKVLQFRKYLLKSEGKSLLDKQKDLPSDVNIKYQMHLYLKSKNSQELLQVLQNLIPKQYYQDKHGTG